MNCLKIIAREIGDMTNNWDVVIDKWHRLGARMATIAASLLRLIAVTSTIGLIGGSAMILATL